MSGTLKLNEMRIIPKTVRKTPVMTKKIPIVTARHACHKHPVVTRPSPRKLELSLGLLYIAPFSRADPFEFFCVSFAGFDKLLMYSAMKFKQHRE